MDSYARLEPHLERVQLKRGQTIYSQVGPVNYLYFPTTAIISIFSETPGGASAEVALIGNDGTLGILAVLCGARAPFRSAVDTSGDAYRITSNHVQNEVELAGSLQRVLMRHLTARMTLIAGNAVCNSQHSVEQRFCRALLMRLERSRSGALAVTHETMAHVLGTRRAGVTRAATDLKRARAITYTRGRLTILNSELLQQRACECYALLNSRIARLNDAQ
jgi:CRP-like cAMP-binding protein